MIDLLLAAHREVAHGPLTGDRMAQINAGYTAILDQGDRVHPIKKRKDSTPHRGQSTPTNPLRRLREYHEYVLRFLSDPEVPFTNNIAEQAVRMPKVKQKISGWPTALADYINEFTFRFNRRFYPFNAFAP